MQTLINVIFRIVFMGFVVRGKGKEVDETKVKAIRDLPTLKSVKRFGASMG